MRFGTVGRMGPEMRQVVRFGDRSTGGCNFWGECEAPHCKQWGFVASRPLLNHFGISCLVL